MLKLLDQHVGELNDAFQGRKQFVGHTRSQQTEKFVVRSALYKVADFCYVTEGQDLALQIVEEQVLERNLVPLSGQFWTIQIRWIGTP